MPVSLSIKAVPDIWAQRLRERAAGNHRSLQHELMALVEAAVGPQGRFRIPHAPVQQLGDPRVDPHVAETAPAWPVVTVPPADGLLAELDDIVAGSRWGEAPLLSRDQLHDRALARELDYDTRHGVKP